MAPVKNCCLSPRNVRPGSRRKVWWICPRGHQWQATVTARTKGAGCPVVRGEGGDPGGERPRRSVPGDRRPVGRREKRQTDGERGIPLQQPEGLVRCREGHSWQAAIAARTKRKTGCPYCTGRKVLAGYNDLATRFPDLARQWHQTMNGHLTPEQVSAGSRRQVWWQCGLGHVWKARVHSRAGKQRRGCPVCAGRARAANHDPTALEG